MPDTNKCPKILALQQKTAIFKAAETEGFETIMKKFRLKRSTCYDILKSKDRVLNTLDRDLKHERLEEKLFEWFKNRDQTEPISGTIIKKKARELRISMKCVDFKVSNEWLDKFKKRFKIEIRRGRRPNNLPKNELPKRGHLPKIKRPGIKSTHIKSNKARPKKEVDNYVIKDVLLDSPKKRRGRPSKKSIPMKVDDNRKNQRESNVIENNLLKKSRGRPISKKNPISKNTSASENKIPEIQQITKLEFNQVLKRPGRPRKIDNLKSNKPRRMMMVERTSTNKANPEMLLKSPTKKFDTKTDWRHTVLMELLRKFLPEYANEEEQL